MKAMIFAAGLGTRLKPLTNDRPKALVEIVGKTLLERNIQYLKRFNIQDITINVHHFSQQIKDFLCQNNDFGISILISDETERLLDTGGGVLKARPFLEGKEPVLFMNVDVLTNLDLNRLLNFHTENRALASLVVRKRDTVRYLLFDQQNQLTGWKNTQTNELKTCRPGTIDHSVPLAFSGIHLIRPELLSMITETGKFSVIDLYLQLGASEKILSFTDSASDWMDLGKYEQIEQAEELIKKGRFQ